MDHTDLVDRLIPYPTHTLVVETPQGEIVLVDTDRLAKQGDTVLAGDSFIAYPCSDPAGVAYCVIKFL